MTDGVERARLRLAQATGAATSLRPYGWVCDVRGERVSRVLFVTGRRGR